jgi:HNH endonuclease
MVNGVWTGSAEDNSLLTSANRRVGRMDVISANGAITLNIRHLPPPGSVDIELARFYSAGRVEFDQCPICFRPAPDSDEHVGPGRLGGAKLTKTCTRCNHELGSKLDAALIAWCTETLRCLAFTSPALLGHRYLPSIDVRGTNNGQFALLVDRPPHPDIRHALQSGEPFALGIWPHNLPRVRLAALKSAYLAACILDGCIPDGDAADGMRDALVKVRNSPRSTALPACAAADTLEIARTFMAPDGEPVALAYGSGTKGEPTLWISFAGVFATSWPLPDHPQVLHRK